MVVVFFLGLFCKVFVVPRFGHPLDGHLFPARPIGKHAVVIGLGEFDETLKHIGKGAPLFVTHDDVA